MNRKIFIAAIAALSVLSCYFFYSYMRVKEMYIDAALTKEASAHLVSTAAQEELVNEEEYVTFYICGEVSNPDIYKLPKGSRIIDAIEAAGGKTEFASFEMMESVAGEISDGQKIYVPNIDDDIDKINYMNNNSNSGYGTAANVKKPDVVVNINTADVDELCQIPGIGPSTAQMIYNYRLENGDFTLIEDIKNVPRIGDKTFESIKKNITVE